MGRIGLKAIVYFEVATTIALFLGSRSSTSFSPAPAWRCRSAPTRSAGGDGAEPAARLGHLPAPVPDLVVDAMARGDILQLVVFSMFFGIAVAAIGPKGQPVLDVLDASRMRCSASPAT
jgi:proton glutamate symport protein